MSQMVIDINFERPELLQVFSRLQKDIRQPGIRRVMGRALANVLREHFTRLDSERSNSLGGKRTHFYGRARRSVQQPELEGGDGVKVSITQPGVAQRYYGGEIKPRTAKALTIPVHPMAYGKRAGEFSDLSYIPVRRSGSVFAILARPHNSGNIGEVMYLLAKKVTQKADPTVLPDHQTMATAALDAAHTHLMNLMERSQN